MTQRPLVPDRDRPSGDPCLHEWWDGELDCCPQCGEAL